MTEPVAWRYKNEYGYFVLSKEKPHPEWDFENIEPLYTADQLHPRVKMTQKQYKEWQSAIRSIYPVNLYELFNLIFNPSEHQGEYAGMRDIFSFDEGQKKLSQLWSKFDQNNPEETIEIVPDMKWFVRSKTPEGEGEEEYYLFLSGSDLADLQYFEFDYAKSFKTKEEAENWTNPLTEAVQLPVEGE